MNTHRFYGTGTALVTPYLADGSIDFTSLAKLIEFQISGGVEYLVVCGSTGESATMTVEEDISVIRFAIEKVNKRIPVVAGTGSNDTKSAAQYHKTAQTLGAAASLSVSPYYNKPTPRGMIAHFKTIADASDLPIIIYNVPGRTGLSMPVDVQLQLAEECPTIIATKEASGNLDQMMEIIRSAPAGFAVLAGDDSLALPLIACGGLGVISVISNYAPSQFSDLVRAALAGDFVKARGLQYNLLELMKLNFIESNPIPAKAALAMMGLIQEHLRLPLVPIGEANKAKLRAGLVEAGILP